MSQLNQPENKPIIGACFTNIKKHEVSNSRSLEDLEREVKEMVSGYFVTMVQNVFDANPLLQSFGWEQFTSAGGPYEKKYGIYSTRTSPDINGKAYDWSVDCLTVIEFLSSFKTELLLVAFGNNCKVTVFRDLTFEVENDYQ